MKKHLLNTLRNFGVDDSVELLDALTRVAESYTKEEKETSFNEGVLYATGITADFLDNPVDAKAILEQAGLQDYDCWELDDTEKESLRKISGLSLRSL